MLCFSSSDAVIGTELSGIFDECKVGAKRIVGDALELLIDGKLHSTSMLFRDLELPRSIFAFEICVPSAFRTNPQTGV